MCRPSLAKLLLFVSKIVYCNAALSNNKAPITSLLDWWVDIGLKLIINEQLSNLTRKLDETECSSYYLVLYTVIKCMAWEVCILRWQWTTVCAIGWPFAILCHTQASSSMIKVISHLSQCQCRQSWQWRFQSEIENRRGWNTSRSALRKSNYNWLADGSLLVPMRITSYLKKC